MFENFGCSINSVTTLTLIPPNSGYIRDRLFVRYSEVGALRGSDYYEMTYEKTRCGLFAANCTASYS